jgi:release factor glutamine methyltransferase
MADPPYVPTADIGQFPEDPRLAIDGGPDGLDVVAECLSVAADHLAADGAVVIQVRGADQVARLPDLAPGLAVVEMRTFGPDRALAHLRAAR